MRIRIRTCEGREEMHQYLQARLIGAVFIHDEQHNAMETFLRALEAAEEEAALHMEDDVLLARDFLPRVQAAVTLNPSRVIQFFSMRAADKTIGAREEPGRTFLMGQCFYLPRMYSAALREFADSWDGHEEHPTGLDTMVADFLKKRRERYYIHVPSLVQHRQCVSRIDPRRSRSRQSQTFEGEG